jgi:hypothetical protein
MKLAQFPHPLVAPAPPMAVGHKNLGSVNCIDGNRLLVQSGCMAGDSGRVGSPSLVVASHRVQIHEEHKFFLLCHKGTFVLIFNREGSKKGLPFTGRPLQKLIHNLFPAPFRKARLNRLCNLSA